MAGGIHHQNQLASIVGHRDVLAIQAGGVELMKSGHAEILKVRVSQGKDEHSDGFLLRPVNQRCFLCHFSEPPTFDLLSVA